jgi:hypothetical protein
MRAWLAATVAAVLLAGCGTAPAGSGTGRALASASVSVSATGLRARALALAWRLVTELSPPPGTRSVHLKKLPPPLTDPLPLPPGWVRVQRTLAGPAEPQAAWAGLLARSPLGQTGGINPGVSAGMFIPAPEPGIDVAEISVTLIQLSSKTILIVTDAEAAWLPGRTAAEHLDPASFRSVTISARRYGEMRDVTGTFTARDVIARLTSIINKGAPAPRDVLIGMHCAPVSTVFTLRFTPENSPGPVAVVTIGPCGHAYGITVNGKEQPSLWNNAGLSTTAGGLLELR